MRTYIRNISTKNTSFRLTGEFKLLSKLPGQMKCPLHGRELLERGMEFKYFYNCGFGWICRQCEAELKREEDVAGISRLMTEGEAESKTPEMSTGGLARWADAAQTALICPRCGISEDVSKY